MQPLFRRLLGCMALSPFAQVAWAAPDTLAGHPDPHPFRWQAKLALGLMGWRRVPPQASGNDARSIGGPALAILAVAQYWPSRCQRGKPRSERSRNPPMEPSVQRQVTQSF